MDHDECPEFRCIRVPKVVTVTTDVKVGDCRPDGNHKIAKIEELVNNTLILFIFGSNDALEPKTGKDRDADVDHTRHS